MNNKKCIYRPTKGPEDWRELLTEPEKQWKTGYSAHSLAYCWENAYGMSKDMLMVLSQAPVFSKLESLVVIPEHKVTLPGGGRSSQNDCWVLARTPNDLVSIAVEGKASESFGTTISEWLKDASPGKNKRLSFLLSELGLNAESAGHICYTMRGSNLSFCHYEEHRQFDPRTVYQLLHRAASALIEARRFHAKHAIMIVHSFSETDEGFDDYKKFVELFGMQAKLNEIVFAGRQNGIDLYLAWVSQRE